MNKQGILSGLNHAPLKGAILVRVESILTLYPDPLC